MLLIIDPYANRHLSMADIRLVNKVAGALVDAHDDLDPGLLARAIGQAYRSGMQAQVLKQHVERNLGLRARPRMVNGALVAE
jgi:hypothetical protein